MLVTGCEPFGIADTKKGNYSKFIKDPSFFFNEFRKFVKFSDEFADLFQKMVEVDEDKRIAVENILEHSWLKKFESK